MPGATVHSIHFEDHNATDFERLVFAYHLRAGRWRSIEWYGQVGSDLGRDILAVDDDGTSQGETLCIQCANHRNLPAMKAVRDLSKAVASPTKPTRMRFVCGGSVSAKTRDKMRAAAAGSHVVCEIWSGPEFEERLRRDCESLLQRFVSGVTFPDSSAELTAFVRSVGGATDREIATALARTFDRPAFYTPFQNEGSIPDFRDALDETIRTLGTGQRRTRDGKDLRPIHSRHDIADSALRDTFAAIERAVAGLRARFDQLLRAGEIRRCADACRNPRCTLYFMSDTAIADMNQIRATILDALRGAVPEVRLRVDWSHEFGG